MLLLLVVQFALAKEPIERSQCAGDNRDVSRSECLVPQGKPKPSKVGIIYLHGRMDNAKQRKLEGQNREKLQALANLMGVSIAVPNSWNPGVGGIEKAASGACGKTPLEEKKSIIGFSDGGLTLQKMALQGAFEQSSYANVMTVGAEAAQGVTPVKPENGEPSRFIMTAEYDDHGAGAGPCSREKGKKQNGCDPFKFSAPELTKKMGSHALARQFRSSCVPAWAEGHVLPDARFMADMLSPQNGVTPMKETQ